MMLTPPAVRFIRWYDPKECRMVNVWMRLISQEQINNVPLATELAVQGQTVEECMVEIRKWHSKWIDQQELEAIEKGSTSLVDAKPSFHGILEQLECSK